MDGQPLVDLIPYCALIIIEKIIGEHASCPLPWFFPRNS